MQLFEQLGDITYRRRSSRD